MSDQPAAPRRVLLVQPWTPTPETWRSMTRYAERIARVIEPASEVSLARASHINMWRPLRRFFPSYRRFEPLPPRWPEPVDLVHFTDIYIGVHARLFEAPRVVTLHDMIPMDLARWYLRGGLRWRAAFLHSLRGLHRADLVITPSEHTKRELLKVRQLDPARVQPVPILVPDEIGPPPPGSERDPATILSIGTTAEYKNLPLLLHALRRPELAGAKLVRIGSPFDFELPGLVRKLGLESRIEQLGPISDERLYTLMQSATLLAQPSLDEGFGMPVAEAMAAGLPVVASDAGALPEVMGGSGVVVPFRKHFRGPPDMDDARDFALALAQVIASREQQRALTATGLREAERFRLPAVRRELLGAYAKAGEFARQR
jgi:glycosyltransferase involved in cell wall biosynthesis